MIDSTKRLVIDASRLKSGGGVLHLTKILEYSYFSKFDEIIVYTYRNSEFEKYQNEKIFIRSHTFINKSIFFQIYWQRFLLKTELSEGDLLFSIDSTTFCNYDKNVILNQDIIGFQEGSFKILSFTNKLISFLKYIVARRAIKRSIACIFTTSFAESEVKKKVGEITNTYIIPHGIDDTGLIRKTDFDNNKSLRIIYVSPILDYKNHKNLVSAINDTAVKSKVSAYFVGGGDNALTDELKSLAKNDLGNTFHFLGYLDREQVYELTRDCDIAVFLSSIECFGISLLEYMRIGMPIICSDQSSMPETLENTGILVDPQSIPEIIDAINSLSLDSKTRREYGKKAYQKSLKYDWEFTARATFEMLNKHS